MDGTRRNYFEQLVDSALDREVYASLSADEKEDLACVALNSLPPRYYRFTIDLSFYLSEADREAMEDVATAAVEQAFRKLFVEGTAREGRDAPATRAGHPDAGVLA